MLVAALFRHDGIPQNVGDLAFYGTSVEIGQVHAVAGEDGHVPVGQEEHVACIAQDGGYVGSDKILTVPQAHHYRRPGARGHDLVGIFPRDDAQREHAGHLFHSIAHGAFEIAVEVFLHQMRDDLRVGLGDEFVPFRDQLLLQGQVILDDAVMHYDDIAVAIAMRMGILFRGPAVGRPARVADAVGAFHRVQPQNLFEVAKLALRPPYSQAVALFQYGDARRVVPAVFQPLQPVQDDGDCLLISDVPNDSTHKLIQNLYSVVFHDGVCEHVARHLVHFLLNFFFGRPGLDLYVEILPLTHGRNGLMP